MAPQDCINLKAPRKKRYYHKGFSSEAPPLSGFWEAGVKVDGRGEYEELAVSRSKKKQKFSRNDGSHLDRECYESHLYIDRLIGPGDICLIYIQI